ncbi:MAG: LysM peptidoglycan-binding domain-containing protein, partial [bacterium]|nr:LysM peptidoglycan-binding domain-containing protein [bacterium]
MALFPAVFLFTAVLFFPETTHAGFFSMLARFFASAPAEVEEQWPSILVPAAQTAAAASALGDENRSPAGVEDDDDAGMNVVQENALVAPLNPVGTVASDAPSAGLIFIYTVRSGDTLTSIAKSFDVSVNTILWANNLPHARSLKVGAQIVILPVSGIKHEVKKGETIASIARKYRGAIDEILQFNGLAPDEKLAVGTTLIVPNGELGEAAPIASSAPRPGAFLGLPVYEGYYLRPIIGGRRSRGIHGYNGVDLANTCGLAVLASADGQVLFARSSGWNGGYGRY